MFFVTNFPTAFTNDIFQEEARFGSSIRVKWVDDTSCLVILQGEEKEGVEEITKRVKAFDDWEVVALHERDDLAGPVAKKIKV
jgi:hypothetical protein